MSEVLTLIQTGKSRRIPVILVSSKFWKGFIDWLHDSLLAEGMLAREDIELMQIIDDTDTLSYTHLPPTTITSKFTE